MVNYVRTASILNRLNGVMEEAGLCEFPSSLKIVYLTLAREAGVSVCELKECREAATNLTENQIGSYHGLMRALSPESEGLPNARTC